MTVCPSAHAVFPFRSRPTFGWKAIGFGAALLACAGCPPRQGPVPLDPVPKHVAISLVNDNLAKIGATLNARGRVRGYVTLNNGSRRHFDLAAHLFFLRPGFLSLDLRADLGGSQIMFGSNQSHYWYYNKQDGDSYWCRRYDRLRGGRDPDLSINPLEIVEALGLTPIGGPGKDNPNMQRIVDEYQQLLFVERDRSGQPILQKEYWLSRRSPQLVSRILFRDAMGRVTMSSVLDKYAPVGPTGIMLPRRIEIDWPMEGTHMAYSISRWRLLEDVKPDGPQFTPPHQRGVRFTNEMIDDQTEPRP